MCVFAVTDQTDKLTFFIKHSKTPRLFTSGQVMDVSCEKNHLLLLSVCLSNDVLGYHNVLVALSKSLRLFIYMEMYKTLRLEVLVE